VMAMRAATEATRHYRWFLESISILGLQFGQEIEVSAG
jgi:hypothetical protein